MSADLTHLRATLTEHGSLDKSTVLALIDRAEKAERQSVHATSALKALAERKIELTEQKRVLNVRFDAMRAGRDSERSRADKKANKLEQAEEAVARVRAVIKGAPTVDPLRGFAGPPDDWPDDTHFTSYGEWIMANRVREALDGETRRLADQGLGGEERE